MGAEVSPVSIARGVSLGVIRAEGVAAGLLVVGSTRIKEAIL